VHLRALQPRASCPQHTRKLAPWLAPIGPPTALGADRPRVTPQSLQIQVDGLSPSRTSARPVVRTQRSGSRSCLVAKCRAILVYGKKNPFCRSSTLWRQGRSIARPAHVSNGRFASNCLSAGPDKCPPPAPGASKNGAKLSLRRVLIFSAVAKLLEPVVDHVDRQWLFAAGPVQDDEPFAVG
jgi:hypothetical protein